MKQRKDNSTAMQNIRKVPLDNISLPAWERELMDEDWGSRRIKFLGADLARTPGNDFDAMLEITPDGRVIRQASFSGESEMSDQLERMKMLISQVFAIPPETLGAKTPEKDYVKELDELFDKHDTIMSHFK